jgi:hypothetical protein
VPTSHLTVALQVEAGGRRLQDYCCLLPCLQQALQALHAEQSKTNSENFRIKWETNAFVLVFDVLMLRCSRSRQLFRAAGRLTNIPGGYGRRMWPQKGWVSHRYRGGDMTVTLGHVTCRMCRHMTILSSFKLPPGT